MRDALFVALVIFLAGALLGSERGFMASNRAVTTEVADIKLPEEFGSPHSYISNYGAHYARQRSPIEQALKGAFAERKTSEPMVGYSVREVTFLGMPFAYYTEMGWVLYYTGEHGIVSMPLNDRGIAMVNKALGRDVRQGFFYPFWWHAWGWLFIAGVALWIYLRHRYIVDKREAEGMI